MELKFMQKFEENKDFLTKDMAVSNESMSLKEIEEVELKYNNGERLPRAFREYLFIGGKEHGLYIVWTDLEMLHEDYKEVIEICEIELDRPIFPFFKLDGSVFTFFYLDDESEDPKCYILTPPGAPGFEHGIELIRPTKNYTFSELVNADIERIKNGWRV